MHDFRSKLAEIKLSMPKPEEPVNLPVKAPIPMTKEEEEKVKERLEPWEVYNKHLEEAIKSEKRNARRRRQVDYQLKQRRFYE